MEPGREAAFDVVLGNKRDSETVKVRVGLAPVTQNRNGGYELAAAADKWSAVPWLILKTDSIMLKPKGR